MQNKNNPMNTCINCGKVAVRSDTVMFGGEVRSIRYEVEMQGFKCANCGYSTLDAKGMTEFSRLLSDKYRAEHGLLTSERILSLRNGFNESQEQFAKRCGIGVATLKRIEKGKIQDADTDKRLRDNTQPLLQSSAQYAVVPTRMTVTGVLAVSVIGFSLPTSGTLTIFASSTQNARVSYDGQWVTDEIGNFRGHTSSNAAEPCGLLESGIQKTTYALPIHSARS
jgi:putative zinc finger/helix-turn-helix YgiT family protein